MATPASSNPQKPTVDCQAALTNWRRQSVSASHILLACKGDLMACNLRIDAVTRENVIVAKHIADYDEKKNAQSVSDRSKLLFCAATFAIGFFIGKK